MRIVFAWHLDSTREFHFMTSDSLPIVLAVLILGLAGGWFLRARLLRWQIDHVENYVGRLKEQAETEEKEIILKAKGEALQKVEDVKIEERERRQELKKTEERLAERDQHTEGQRGRLEREETELG